MSISIYKLNFLIWRVHLTSFFIIVTIILLSLPIYLIFLIGLMFLFSCVAYDCLGHDSESMNNSPKAIRTGTIRVK